MDKDLLFHRVYSREYKCIVECTYFYCLELIRKHIINSKIYDLKKNIYCVVRFTPL